MIYFGLVYILGKGTTVTDVPNTSWLWEMLVSRLTNILPLANKPMGRMQVPSERQFWHPEPASQEQMLLWWLAVYTVSPRHRTLGVAGLLLWNPCSRGTFQQEEPWHPVLLPLTSPSVSPFLPPASSSISHTQLRGILWKWQLETRVDLCVHYLEIRN